MRIGIFRAYRDGLVVRYDLESVRGMIKSNDNILDDIKRDAIMAMENSKSPRTEQPVWFITGCSTGFGRELAKLVLERGYRAVVTARNLDDISDLIAKGDSLGLKLDVTNPDQVGAAIKAAEDKFGHIDVLVNNAGIGYLAAVEESEEDQVRRMF